MTDTVLIQQAQQGSISAREQIISDNSGLVWGIARRFIGRGADLDDIYQIGCMGMLKAVNRFDFGYNVQFSTYAVPLIAGEIKRFLRDDGMIKVSRSMRTLASRALIKREEYINEHGTEPTVAELAQALDTDAETLIVAMEAATPCEYLYKKSEEGEDTYLIDKVSYDLHTGETDIDSLAVRLAVETLDERDREIIQQRYFYGKTQTEVAREMNVSQVQICRREKRILLKLRGVLTP